eukprot:10293907-Lingulodinium_polyedra.AAC.1
MLTRFTLAPSSLRVRSRLPHPAGHPERSSWPPPVGVLLARLWRVGGWRHEVRHPPLAHGRPGPRE